MIFLCNRSVKGDEAADAFEELTYAAQWRVVMVKVVGYQQGGDKTIPCVRIIDTNGPTVSLGNQFCDCFPWDFEMFS